MERWYSKFKRGDVWYLHMDTESGDGIEKSSVQKKSRPYVIVSCEENNNNAPTFNVLPICTRNNDHLPMHVFSHIKMGLRQDVISWYCANRLRQFRLKCSIIVGPISCIHSI